MKKIKVLCFCLMILCLSLIGFLISKEGFLKDKNVVSEESHFKDKKVYSTGIAMMLETNYNTGEYKETTDSSWAEAIEKGYSFNETRSKCENGSILTWDEVNKKVTFTGNISDKCYVYFDKKPTIADKCIGKNMASCIAENYELDTAIYYHDGVGTYGEYEAGDNSYRYAGANPNNYVCFGSDANPCPVDNLYRIIGVFDGRVKLIKYDYATSDMLGTDGDYHGTGTHNSTYKGSQSTWYQYYWNKSNNNIWSESNLNKVNLNTNYLNNLGTIWSNKIADSTWKVGGNSWDNLLNQKNAKLVYQAEITNSGTGAYAPTDNKITYETKIGLMYLSDYRYAASPTNVDTWSVLALWNTDAAKDYRVVKESNWLYLGTSEWTITRNSDSSRNAYFVSGSGNLNVTTVSGGGIIVRPCFYLNDSVTLIGGLGTVESPFMIS